MPVADVVNALPALGGDDAYRREVVGVDAVGVAALLFTQHRCALAETFHRQSPRSIDAAHP